MEIKTKKKWHVEGGLFFLFRIVELILWMFLGLNIFVSLYGAIIERKRFAKSFVAVLTRILKYPRTSQGITLYSVQDCSLPNGCFPKIQVCTKSHPDPSGFFFFTHRSCIFYYSSLTRLFPEFIFSCLSISKKLSFVFIGWQVLYTACVIYVFGIFRWNFLGETP